MVVAEQVTDAPRESMVGVMEILCPTFPLVTE